MTLRDLSAKDVIRLKTGENLGRIDDVVFDEHGGQLQSVILRGRASAPSAPTSSWSMPSRCPAHAAADVCKSYILCKIPQNRLYFLGYYAIIKIQQAGK